MMMKNRIAAFAVAMTSAVFSATAQQYQVPVSEQHEQMQTGQ